jgi:hypothetical protein
MKTDRHSRPSAALVAASLTTPAGFAALGRDVWRGLEARAKWILTAACAAAAALFWLAGRSFGIPRHPDFDASLALQPRPAAVLLLTGFLLWVCVAICTAMTSRVRLDAGLFAACVGLAALSVRGGPMRFEFQRAIENGSGRGIFVALGAELVILYGFLALAWYGLWALHVRGSLEGDALRDGLADREHAIGERMTAAAAQFAAMFLLMLLLARADDKKQVLAAVFLSSFLATLLAFTFAPVRPSTWFWAGPLAVGLIGYAWNYLNWGRGGWSVWKAGLGAGMLAPLGRPLPLDYASLGPAGAILGYWISRGWERAKEAETETAGGAPAHSV